MKVFAARVLMANLALASGGIIKIEKFDNSACGTANLKDVGYMDDTQCTDTNEGGTAYWYKWSCSGGNLVRTYYSEAACSTVVTTSASNATLGGTVGATGTCHATHGGSNGEQYTCDVSGVPMGEYSAWTASTCSGTRNSGGKFPYGVCVPDTDESNGVYGNDTSYINAVSGTDLVKKTYPSIDCSGTAVETVQAPVGPCAAHTSDGSTSYYTITVPSAVASGATATMVAGPAVVVLMAFILAIHV